MEVTSFPSSRPPSGLDGSAEQQTDKRRRICVECLARLMNPLMVVASRLFTLAKLVYSRIVASRMYCFGGIFDVPPRRWCAGLRATSKPRILGPCMWLYPLWLFFCLSAQPGTHSKAKKQKSSPRIQSTQKCDAHP